MAFDWFGYIARSAECPIVVLNGSENWSASGYIFIQRSFSIVLVSLLHSVKDEMVVVVAMRAFR